ncbi:ethanolamine ammonia-lyase subunit EutB [Schlesneria paludicola]|uniref:ethanolamine ammonia-lyase subunit EutB n=1 Tax=Schlesneria paludicola TaxID=360056 RepID=UPI000299D8FD|nr:ethanolamine ammonia-lyase subunit EutB [Schlesneria paludicola]
MFNRRQFLAAVSVPLAFGRGLVPTLAWAEPPSQGVDIATIRFEEDIFSYLQRQCGKFEIRDYQQILGAANEFKEGDALIGVAAANDVGRSRARELLANTVVSDLMAHPPWKDQLSQWNDSFASRDALGIWAQRTVGALKQCLLTSSAAELKSILPGLTSDVIACLVRLMSNDELIAIGRTIFHPLHGSNIGSQGYLGARVQPNSPTDNVDDIRFQVFDAFAYAVGDVLLGTNPVSSDPRSVAAVELALQDVLKTFQIDHVIPHCVLAHIDVQAEVERVHPGSTEFWFQSIAGNDDANATFDISLEKMAQYARSRTGRFGLYLESGQGADFTNGHGHGCDMVLLESRKYGFARGMAHEIAKAKNIPVNQAWLHINDVAGFIGPEVFRTREQLVRCCLEDIVMGKLHGLTIGLDVCSTLHMDISLDDLDWCLEHIAPANPAYLMALPTKIDPMLGYLTTGFQDHVRLREKFGYRVDDRMWSFFQQIGVISADGKPTEHFGDPTWVYLQYCRRKNDVRTDAEIVAESNRIIAEIRQRGVFLAQGFGERPSELAPKIRAEIQTVYEDAKRCIWKEWDPTFVKRIPNAIPLATRSSNRNDYILHPTSGEHLSDESCRLLEQWKVAQTQRWDTVIVVSEGLNALAMMDEGNLLPLLDELRPLLTQSGLRVAPQIFVVNSGRVRAGYRIGEILFGGLPDSRTIIHLIGERPGSGHHTLSAYLTAANGTAWKVPDQVDHNITRVVSGIADTALVPTRAARDILTALAR